MAEVQAPAKDQATRNQTQVTLLCIQNYLCKQAIPGDNKTIKIENVASSYCVSSCSKMLWMCSIFKIEPHDKLKKFFIMIQFLRDDSWDPSQRLEISKFFIKRFVAYDLERREEVLGAKMQIKKRKPWNISLQIKAKKWYSTSMGDWFHHGKRSSSSIYGFSLW